MKDYIRKALKYTIVAVGLAFFFISFIPGTWFVKTLPYLATSALAFAPDLLRLLGVKISKTFEIWFYVFVVFAMIFGIDLDFYKWEFFPYDKVVHLASGCLSAAGAKELLGQASGKPDKLWFKALFSMAFVALVAVLWECFEFMMDQLFGQHMQTLISEGVADTMWDLISALIGGVIATTFTFPERGAN